MTRTKKRAGAKHGAKGKSIRKRKGSAGNPFAIEIIPGVGGNPPTVDQPTVKVSKNDKTRVKWWSKHTDDWAVVFLNDTPFERYCFSASTPGNNDVTGTVTQTYKYSVFVEGEGIDPVIIVTP